MVAILASVLVTFPDDMFNLLQLIICQSLCVLYLKDENSWFSRHTI